MKQSEQLVFSELTYETQDWVTKKLKEDQRALCEYSFASNYAWSPYFSLRLARIGESGRRLYSGQTKSDNKKTDTGSQEEPE